MKVAYDIIILAGQSNAEGSGLGRVGKKFKENDLIMEMVDVNRKEMMLEDNGKLNLIQPFELSIGFAKEDPHEYGLRGNLAHSFAEEYIKKGYLKEGRKVLIVKTAVGGTGFAKNHWGKGNILSERMYHMIDSALSTCGDSKIVAFLWHQGESDAFENEELSSKARESFYFDKFDYLISTVRQKYGDDFPIVAGGFTAEWSALYKEQCEAVYRATKRVLKMHNGAFVDTRYLKSNNQDIQNGDNIHFCKKALNKLGRMYFDKYQKLINK